MQGCIHNYEYLIFMSLFVCFYDCGHLMGAVTNWYEVAEPFYGMHCKDKIPKFSKQIFPEKEYRGLSPHFHLPVSVSELYIPTIVPILLEEICRPILGLYKSLMHRHMNVVIGAEAALFPEKEYITGIFIAVW
jgi:hypothetical protein